MLESLCFQWNYDYGIIENVAEAKNEPKPKKSRQSKIKVILIVFFDRGVIYHEFLPEGQTVNKEYYLAVLRRLREAIRPETAGFVSRQFVDFSPR